MTGRCQNCDRDSTALTDTHLEFTGGHTTRLALCSGCIGAIELTLLQRSHDNYRYARWRR